MLQRFTLFFLSWLAIAPVVAQTMVDPAFQAHEFYKPATIERALQLTGGTRVLMGGFVQAAGAPCASNLRRYLPNGTADGAFNAQVDSYGFKAYSIAEAPGGQLIVLIYGTVQVAGQAYAGAVRLNANGSVDPAFVAAIPASLEVNALGVQADGKILVGGFNSSAAPLVRLNANGSFDNAFATQLGNTFGSGSMAYVKSLLVQPDSKIVVAGNFDTGTQLLQPPVVRLLSSGALDGSFAASGIFGTANGLALQPDGKVLVGGLGRLVTRLLPDGTQDLAFNAPTTYSVPYQGTTNSPVIDVLASGHIVACVASGVSAVRLLPDGTLDSSWQVASNGDTGNVMYSVQALPSGQVLVGGVPKHYSGPTGTPVGVGVLDGSTGAYVPGFAPVLESTGVIKCLALQPDGRIVVGGAFLRIDNVPAGNIARFNSNGTLDQTFTTNAQVRGGAEAVTELKLLPTGGIILCGGFREAGGVTQSVMARLLPTGLADPAWSPWPLMPTRPSIGYFVVQPDGKVIASGSSSATVPVVRYDVNGQVDPSFQPPTATPRFFGLGVPLLLQPDGKLIVANLKYTPNAPNDEFIARLLPNGQPDPSFTAPAGSVGNFAAQVFNLALYPDGRLLASGVFDHFGTHTTGGIVRLQANGAIDGSFAAPFDLSNVKCMALQPNGRLLLGGQRSSFSPVGSLMRIMPTGAADASFSRAQGPSNSGYSVEALAVQPDGAILAAGTFTEVGGQPRQCLVRLLDANVLSVSASRLPCVAAYPVPAHGSLTLRLDAAARPLSLKLHNPMGRLVYQQAMPSVDTSLDVSNLLPGVYLLRVEYAEGGPITRRIVVE